MLALFVALLPAISFADSNQTVAVPQGFSGIFTCNQNGANALSVGALGATGGVYVPVADATVELNTGTIVYKECILREVVDAERESGTAGLVQVGTNNILTGRNGSPYFVKQQGPETVQVSTNAIQSIVQNGLSALDPNIQQQVKSAIAQGYAKATYNAPSALTCPYAGATSAFSNPNAQFSWNNILAVASPCNPIVGYIDANNLANAYAAQEQNCLQNILQWGGGFYAVTTGSGGPCEQQIVTPSYNVANSYSTLLNSGFNQLQSANDIGQMVGALFAGIDTQVLSGTGGGISGLSQPVGSSPSYLQNVVNQENQNLQTQIANTALVNLQASLQTEQAYYNIMSSIAGTLEGTISSLRSSENQCWTQVVQAVCSGPVAANGTCTEKAGQCTDNADGTQTCPTGATLHVATSTAFSQAVVNSQISSLASTTANNLQISQQALGLINQLIQNVSGSSADAQALAITQLNTLISNNELHTPADITTAQSQQQAVQNAMQTLAQNTPSLWAGTDPNNSSSTNIPWNGSTGATITATDPGVGWCNFKNQTTLQAWIKNWGG
ncbi:MAG: hypothetical protein P4L81_00755 [Candidatus Pacebacteria bacterium]|nr:hypothetical protein [Candidatus Paceibacterota bacterium]